MSFTEIQGKSGPQLSKENKGGAEKLVEIFRKSG
jgi:hypothetical protein